MPIISPGIVALTWVINFSMVRWTAFNLYNNQGYPASVKASFNGMNRKLTTAFDPQFASEQNLHETGQALIGVDFLRRIFCQILLVSPSWMFAISKLTSEVVAPNNSTISPATCDHRYLPVDVPN